MTEKFIFGIDEAGRETPSTARRSPSLEREAKGGTDGES
jgi:hypothetical protein